MNRAHHGAPDGLLLFAFLAAAGLGCGGAREAPSIVSEPERNPTDDAAVTVPEPASEAGHDARVAHALPGPLRAAVDRLEAMPTLQGSYRIRVSVGGMMGTAGGPAQLQEGVFHYVAPDRFRTTGTQSNENAAEPHMHVDLVVDRRHLTLVNAPLPVGSGTQTVTTIGAAMFGDDPLDLQTTISGSPFGGHHVLSSLREMLLHTSFQPVQTIQENGLTGYVGTRDLSQYVGALLERRDPSLAPLVLAHTQTGNGTPDLLLAMHVRMTADLLAATRTVVVYVDESGMISGWDLGASRNTLWYALRLDELVGAVPGDAFAVDPAVARQANDLTQGLVIQTKAQRHALNNAAAVDAVRRLLLEQIADITRDE